MSSINRSNGSISYGVRSIPESNSSAKNKNQKSSKSKTGPPARSQKKRHVSPPIHNKSQFSPIHVESSSSDESYDYDYSDYSYGSDSASYSYDVPAQQQKQKAVHKTKHTQPQSNDQDVTTRALTHNPATTKGSNANNVILDDIPPETESPTVEVQGTLVYGNWNDDHDMPTTIFKYRSVADSILNSINMYRETVKRPCLQEDKRLYEVAMLNSRRIAQGEIPCDTSAIPKQLASIPLVYYSTHVAHFPSSENAFFAVVNSWANDKNASKELMNNYNVGGVGVCVGKDDEVYFTLILAMRTNIGYSFYSGMSLKSIMLAEKCLNLTNKIRDDEFALFPFKLDLDLCDHAFAFAKMEMKEITRQLVADKVGICSSFNISFYDIKLKNAKPRNIVQALMNQIGKRKTILGDYNRVGYGFVEKQDILHSVILYTRRLSSAVVDGSERISDTILIVDQIANVLNEFREQHSLQPLNLDDDLCTVAQLHAEYVANGQKGVNPIDDTFYSTVVEPNYEATDVSHLCCNEISRAAKVFMGKWRNNTDCISVILNQVDDFGIGYSYDENYTCHISVIIGSRGNEVPINNVIVKL